MFWGRAVGVSVNVKDIVALSFISHAKESCSAQQLLAIERQADIWTEGMRRSLQTLASMLA